MKAWPEFDEPGDLPLGIHPATLNEIIQRFGTTARRACVARRWECIHQLVSTFTGVVDKGCYDLPP